LTGDLSRAGPSGNHACDGDAGLTAGTIQRGADPITLGYGRAVASQEHSVFPRVGPPHKEKTMSTQADALERDKTQGSGADPASLLQSAGDVASDAAARLSRHAKDAASGLASEANQNVKGLLNNQLAAGADLADHFAEAVRAAADHLAPNAPQLAGLVRSGADTVEDFSGSVRDRSVEDLLQAASDFARRQPAAAFGAAAVAGFFLFRVLKADSAPSRAGTDGGHSGGAHHGA
jgi:ElaB/YqjD/DUF883 family membrane-anchored ribosome-binding protein